MADKGVPVRRPSQDDEDDDVDVKKEPAALVLEADAEYPDYEELINAGSIKFQDPEKMKLGPRPKKNKRGAGKMKEEEAGGEPLGAWATESAPMVDNSW